MSTDYFLDEHAAQLQRDGEFIKGEIEKREAELVELRRDRDNAFVRAAEMRTAANILRDIGLRSEMTARGPFVAMDYVPKRPETEPVR